MNIFEKIDNTSERNQFTRQCIGEALIKLMKTSNIDSISVKDIVKCAGVSRMTYYKYYSSKTDILTDYMYQLVKEYISQTKSRDDIGKYNDYSHIYHCINYFSNYADYALTLINANLYSIIINTVNKYMDIYVLPHSRHTIYEVYYYSGAICNVYAKWIESGMKESPEDIAKVIYQFVHFD